MTVSAKGLLTAGLTAALVTGFGAGSALAEAQTQTHTGPNGGTVERVYDPETGEYTAVKTRIGAEGSERTVERKCVTGPEGQVSGCAAQRTVTGAQGESFSNDTYGIRGTHRLRGGQRVTGEEDKNYGRMRRFWLPQND